jgi:PTH1 family peptidyl-tRNA hydrolase
MRGISDGAEALAAGDSAKFLNAVSLRVAPARNSGTGGESAAAEPKAAAKPATPPAPSAPPEAPASPFDRLRGLLRKGD